MRYFKNHRLFLPKLSMAGLSQLFFKEDGGHHRSLWVGSGVVIEKTGEITQGQSLAGMAHYLAMAELLRKDFGYTNITWTVGDADAKKVRPKSEHLEIDRAAWNQLKMLQNVVDHFDLQNRYRFLLSSELPNLFADINVKPGYTSPDGIGQWHQQILGILQENCGDFFNLPAIQAIEDETKQQAALADTAKKMEYVTTQIDDMLFSVQAENAEGRLGWGASDQLAADRGKWDERTFNELYEIVCRQLRKKYGAEIPDNYSYFYARAETFPGKASACPYSVSKNDIESRILMTDSEDEIRRKLVAYTQAAHSTKPSRITGAERRTKEAHDAINSLQFLQNTIWAFNKAFRPETVPRRLEDLGLIYFDPTKGNKLVIHEDEILAKLLEIQKIFLTPTPSHELLLMSSAQKWVAESLPPVPDYSLARRLHHGISASTGDTGDPAWKTSIAPQNVRPIRYLPKPEVPEAVLEQGRRYDALLEALETCDTPVQREHLEFSIMESCADYVRALHHTARQEVLRELKEKGMTNACQFFAMPEEEANLYLEGLRFHRLLEKWYGPLPDAEGWVQSKDDIQDKMIATCPGYIQSLSSKRRERQIKILALEKKGMSRALAVFQQQATPSDDIKHQTANFYELIKRWDQSSQDTRFRSLIEAQLLERCPDFVSSLPQGPQRKIFRILHNRGMQTVISAYRLQSVGAAGLVNPGRYVERLMNFWQELTEAAPAELTDTIRDNIENLMVRNCFHYFASLPEQKHSAVLEKMRRLGMQRAYDFYSTAQQARTFA